MRKRPYIGLVILLVAVTALAMWEGLHGPEPAYEGKPLSVWLASHNSIAISTEAQEAVRQMGTNAIPTLLRMLRAKESLTSKCLYLAWELHLIGGGIGKEWTRPQEALVGFECLGAAAKDAVPQLVMILTTSPSAEVQSCAAGALAAIGPGAKAAIPSLLKVMGTATNAILVREWACKAIGQIHAEPDLVIPALIQATQDPDRGMRLEAIRSIHAFREDAITAVSTLTALLNDRDSAIRSIAKRTLLQIDPVIAAKAGVNTNSQSQVIALPVDLP